MRYIDVRWIHDNQADPVRFMSELDQDRYETRKLEFFMDGSIGFAHVADASLAVELGTVQVPSLDAINAHPGFSGTEISSAAFEAAWREALAGQAERAHSPYSGKIVLVSSTGYAPGRDERLLRDLYRSRIALFCVLGVDAAEWEDALDWICAADEDQSGHLIVTTAHADESLAQVMEFARQFATPTQQAVQVLRR